MARTRSNLIHLDEERMARRGERPMDGAETLDELVYLLDAGVHPYLAAQMLGKTWAALLKLADRYGRSEEIVRDDLDAWRRYSAPDRRPAA
ncbi:hypothetical protein SK224_05410 [Microbacterium sp. BG28]|uniref:hypothetical protein n=1 Tax=Microbacterium sp. BG28 TaxID=3097356 RepID=UPI002A5B105C|nr:hypothetical protein [Microbacterium sp. BG28]MDY0828562.1 hypothetical protein [Microbacterium sp. BG28]